MFKPTVLRALLAWCCFAALIAFVPAARANHEAGVDLSTPRRALTEFSVASRSADHHRAAAVLDLRRIPSAERTEQGPALARQLKLVLDRALWIDGEDLSDSPQGNPTDGPQSEHLGDVHVKDGQPVPINMSAVQRPDGSRVWLFSSQTVAQIPRMYETYANRWQDRLPHWMLDIYVWELAVWQWAGLAALAIVSLMIGGLLSWISTRVTMPFVKSTAATWDDELLLRTKSPIRVLIMLLAYRALVPALELNPPALEAVGTALTLFLIAAFGWLLTRFVQFSTVTLEQHAQKRAQEEGADDRLRGLRTQLSVLRRIVNILIGALSVAFMLMQFQAVRNVGVSLLASAGVAGIVLGLAAQKPVTALLAGLQMSVTQPIRIGDAVVVQTEFGTIEEIKLSHVVVKLWDDRRLIVPTTYFLDNTFQNWSRVSPELTGQVFLFADFALPVEALRAELERLLQDQPLWDGRVKNVAVTDAGESTIQLRILVSARDAGKLWDLRCFVRERLVAWLRDLEHGRYLPRRRVEAEVSGEGDRRISSADIRTG